MRCFLLHIEAAASTARTPACASVDISSYFSSMAVDVLSPGSSLFGIGSSSTREGILVIAVLIGVGDKKRRVAIVTANGSVTCGDRETTNEMQHCVREKSTSCAVVLAHVGGKSQRMSPDSGPRRLNVLPRAAHE